MNGLNLGLAVGTMLMPNINNVRQLRTTPTLIEKVFNQNYTAKTNIYEKTWYIDDELDEVDRYEIVEYQTMTYGQTFNIKTRAINKIVRGIGDEEYTYRSKVLIELNNNTPLNINTLLYEGNLNTVSTNNKIRTKTVELYTKSTLTTQQQDFINGANYNNYTEISTMFSQLGTGTYVGNVLNLFDEITFANTNQYLMLDINIEYYDTRITDNGSFMNSLVLLTKLQETLEYEVTPSTSQEVIDIPDIMFTLLGMPFAFYSTAFNLTLFPGTAYAINIADVVWAIIGSLIIIIIIKVLFKNL